LKFPLHANHLFVFKTAYAYVFNRFVDYFHLMNTYATTIHLQICPLY